MYIMKECDSVTCRYCGNRLATNKFEIGRLNNRHHISLCDDCSKLEINGNNIVDEILENLELQQA